MTKKSIRKLSAASMLAAAALTIGIGTVFAATTTVSPSGMSGWDQQNFDVSTNTDTGTATTTTGTGGYFVTGPGTPPAGTGSFQEVIGTDGDDAVRVRTSAYGGTPLSQLTELQYSTYVQQSSSDSLAPYLQLRVDRDGNGTTDDVLFFEPAYQNGTYGTTTYGVTAIPNQCGGNPNCVTEDVWQTWDASAGGWWSSTDSAGGPPLFTLADYAAEYPDARLSTDVPSFRVQSGGGAPTWDNFIGNIDAVIIASTTFDFEPSATSTPTTSPMVKVTINKFIDGQMATSGSAMSSSFPMEASWDAANLGGAGSGSYDLDVDGFNSSSTPYQAVTSDMTAGSDYATHEVTSGSVVGATCADNKPYALSGYSVGDTLAQAQSAATTTQSPAFSDLTSDKFVIVWNEDCTGSSTPPAATTSQVTIIKYVNGEHATAANATSTTFPFTATYQASNVAGGNQGSDPFTIGPVGNGTPNAYEAMTIPLANGAMYNATENTSGNDVVGATCADGKPFALSGYSSGDTLAQAQTASTSSTSPTFNNLQSDKYVIVWNTTCAGTTTPPTPPVANACATPGTAPAGYTLQNGTSGNDNVELAANTMYVGKGGNDHVSGGDGNYIVCTGNGNDRITLGNGNSTIDAGGGNNHVAVGNGEGYIKTGNGNDMVDAGNGARTIEVGGGNNNVETGDQAQTITSGSGNDQINAGGGNDTVNAGGGNNMVWGEGGADMLTSASGNDHLDGGAGTDTCQAGGGNNNKISCEL